MVEEEKDYNEEEDEDFQPEPDQEGDVDSDQNNTPVNKIDRPLSWLPPNQQREVDDAFASLFGTREKSEEVTNRSAKKRKRGADCNAQSSSWKKKKQILSGIFGGNQIASKLMDTSGNTISLHTDNLGERKYPTLVKQVITETKRFAGQNIEIQRTVTVDATSKNSSNPSNSSPTASEAAPTTTESTTDPSSEQTNSSPNGVVTKPMGIDALLTQINKPSKISTISKSSADWSVFKDTKTGLKEELQQKSQGNDAYLVKQDFLQRVDERRFEQEKEVRSQLRAAAKVDK